MSSAGGAFFDAALLARATALLDSCRSRGIQIATAESCTGGLVAALLTEIPGSSAGFDRGFVTYSNEAKVELIGVPEATLARHGAVSAETAAAMVEGTLQRSRATLAVSITGIAGPGGGTQDKPVGMVHFGVGVRGKPVQTLMRRFGPLERGVIRLAAVEQALTLLEQAVG